MYPIFPNSSLLDVQAVYKVESPPRRSRSLDQPGCDYGGREYDPARTVAFHLVDRLLSSLKEDETYGTIADSDEEG
jgi:hypothetical protein